MLIHLKEAEIDLKAVSDDIKGIDAEIAEASNELKDSWMS